MLTRDYDSILKVICELRASSIKVEKLFLLFLLFDLSVSGVATEIKVTMTHRKMPVLINFPLGAHHGLDLRPRATLKKKFVSCPADGRNCGQSGGHKIVFLFFLRK